MKLCPMRLAEAHRLFSIFVPEMGNISLYERHMAIGSRLMTATDWFDPEAAAIVKRISAMAQEGIAIAEIVRRLNRESVLPPSLYARQNGWIGKYQDADGYWNEETVKKVLTNYTYTGNLVQGGIGYLPLILMSRLSQRKSLM